MGRIPHRPGGPWSGILLAASVLGSCLQLALAQTPGTTTPLSPVVGRSVSPTPAQTLVTTTPPSTVQIRSPTSPVLSSVDLRVSEILPKPTVTPGQTQVLENGTFTLTCNGSPSADTVLWLRDGAYLAPNERLVLYSDNRTLTVLNVTRGDAGAYQCEVRNPVSTDRSEPSTVMLAYGPDSARIDPPGPINLTFGLILTLTCVADSVPAPSYRWVLNGTDTKETGSSLTINLTTWAQQGTYECWAHNPVTGRTAWASVAVWVTGTGAPSALSAWAVAGIIIGSLAGAALVGVGVYFLYSPCRNETHKENEAPVLVYENLPPTAWVGPVAQPRSPPDPSPTYQTLQPQELDVYEELKK